ncbi:MAG: hypothetical protein IPG18_00305 [Saprospiraceae bacterium]|nr:hypothetical protein [Saprospiraceae bacterium]
MPKSRTSDVVCPYFLQLFFETLNKEGSFFLFFWFPIWISKKPDDLSFGFLLGWWMKVMEILVIKGLLQMASGKVFSLENRLKQNDDSNFYQRQR